MEELECLHHMGKHIFEIKKGMQKCVDAGAFGG
jgi:hypothetical protein